MSIHLHTLTTQHGHQKGWWDYTRSFPNKHIAQMFLIVTDWDYTGNENKYWQMISLGATSHPKQLPARTQTPAIVPDHLNNTTDESVSWHKVVVTHNALEKKRDNIVPARSPRRYLVSGGWSLQGYQSTVCKQLCWCSLAWLCMKWFFLNFKSD